MLKAEDGASIHVIGPIRRVEQIGWRQPRFEWSEWPDGRVSDCYVDERRVSSVEFRRLRAEVRRI